MPDVQLIAATPEELSGFCERMRAAFAVAVVETSGFLDEEKIPPAADVRQAFDDPACVVYQVVHEGRQVGGAILRINAETRRNSLDLFFISPERHGGGLGFAAWRAIERMYPETLVWETCTPWFEKRNIHFYVNKCGFKIVEFQNEHHHDSHEKYGMDEPPPDFDFFTFEKDMRKNQPLKKTAAPLTSLPEVALIPVTPEALPAFNARMKKTFRQTVLEHFGETYGDDLSEDDLRKSLEEPDTEVYQIVHDGQPAGGVMLKIHAGTRCNSLELLFIAPEQHSRGLGQAAWREIERRHPETLVWQTCTPYFAKRNIHFYVNKCGFQITRFFHKQHPDPDGHVPQKDLPPDLSDTFIFEKKLSD